MVNSMNELTTINDTNKTVDIRVSNGFKTMVYYEPYI